MALSRGALAYISGLFILALLILLWALPALQPADVTGLIVLTVLLAVSQLTAIRLGPIGTFSFMLSAMYVVAPVMVGVPSAAWAACISTIVYGVITRRQWWRNLYNIGQHVLSIAITGTLYLGLGGKTGAEFNHPLQALVAGAWVFMFGSISFAAYDALITNRPYGSVLVSTLRRSGVYTPVSVLMATVSSYVLSHGGPVWTGTVVLCFLLLQVVINRSAAIYSASDQRSNEMAAVLNATKSAIVTVENQVIRMANEKFGKLVGYDAQLLSGMPLHQLQRSPLTASLAAERPAASDGSVDRVIVVEGESEGEERRYFDCYIGPIAGRDGAVQGTIEILTDVTREKKAEENLRQMHHAMLRALTAAVDARDTYTHGHSARVAEYATIITRELNLDQAETERIGYAALLHDIGKLGVDDRVLRKHGPLTPNERAIMMAHPVIGAQVLEKAEVFTDLIPGVRWHHEWVNGGGYPDGLKGDRIPLDARIICVADAFDAMTSDRPYRGALPAAEAMARLQTGKGVQFDEKVVVAFESAFNRGDIVLSHLAPKLEGEPEQIVEEQEAGTIRPVHGKELDIVYQVSKENYARLNVSAVLRRFLEIFYDSIGHNVYMILLTDAQSGELVLHSSLGHAQELGQVRVRRGEGIVGTAAATGKPVVVRYVDQSQRYIPLIPETRSEIAVPLLFNNEVIGVLNVESAVPNVFTRDDLYLFEALAQQVASALELARYHERIAFAASHDGLTGVLNHNHFYERLTEEVTRAKRYMHDLSVMILDLNGLKAVNDTYGHVTGDIVLKEYAQVLRSQVRDVDIVARYGGDEFAIIMPETSKQEAQTVVQRVMRHMEGLTFQAEGSTIRMPAAAIGIASFPLDADRATELVAIADRVMYENKPGGRSRRPS